MTASAQQRASLADYLSARRESLRLTIAAVAARCGKTAAWYGYVESGGRRRIGPGELALLEKALQLPKGDLVKRAEEAGF